MPRAPAAPLPCPHPPPPARAISSHRVAPPSLPRCAPANPCRDETTQASKPLPHLMARAHAPSLPHRAAALLP
uniref:Uncharacterized protein n=1 Tax=Arundo donax TaxID=35708 RepID=A0A0A9B7E0_ARUDO